MKISTYKTIIGYFLLFFSIFLSVHVKAEPWRLSKAANLPTWFKLSGEHRTRFETLDGQFRGNLNGGDQGLFFRTLIKGELNFESLKFVGEFIDARSTLTDSGTSLNNSSINPTDLLQAYVSLPLGDFFGVGGQSEVRVGRFTMNIGKRRLISRNRFRNTINSFTGVDWQWHGSNNQELRAFYVLPVQRLVDGDFLDDRPAFDKQDEEVSLWGLFYKTAAVPWHTPGDSDTAELYVFGLNENDTAGRPTADRDIVTIGARLFNKPVKQQFDYEFETAYQFGDSRSSSSANVDLDHDAFFQHAEIGYSFDAPLSPRLIAQYDYASGDDDPNDGDNNRFQTLFGSRGFDYGPTGLYGAFARANISSPGLRLILKPNQNIKSYFTLRGFWLAESSDQFTTARITPQDGNTYVGTQLEGHVRWNVLPGNLRVDTGFTHLVAGEVLEDAGESDSTYFYTQAIFTF